MINNKEELIEAIKRLEAMGDNADSDSFDIVEFEKLEKEIMDYEQEHYPITATSTEEENPIVGTACSRDDEYDEKEQDFRDGIKKAFFPDKPKDNIISSESSDLHCVCQMANTNGESVYKIMSEGLAKQWKQYRMFTGTHKECLDFMRENGY